MGSLTKRGNKYQAKVRKKGYDAVSKTFATKALAERWIREIETDMDRQVFVSHSALESTKFEELTQLYEENVAQSMKSFANIQCRLRGLNRHFGHLFLRESVGRALLNDERRLRIHHLNIRAKKERRRIGFV